MTTVLVFAAAAALWAGCAQPAPQARIRTSSFDSLNVSSSLEHAEGDFVKPQVLHLAAAINETIGFAFSVDSPNGELPNPRLRVTDLTSSDGRIGASAVQLFRMETVRAPRLPGWHIRQIPTAERTLEPYDVLVPIAAPMGALPQSLPPKRKICFWADILIPKGTPAGVYGGKLQLHSNARLVTEVPIELTVWPFVLPDMSRVSMIADIDQHSLSALPDAETVTHAAMQLLRDHRLHPVLPELRPEVRIGAGGEVIVDWSKYDQTVRPYLDGSAFADQRGLSYWPAPLKGIFTSSISSATLSASPQYVDAFLRQSAEHFAENGWTHHSYLMLPDEVCSSSGGAPMLAVMERMRGVPEPPRIASPCFPQDMRPFGWLTYSAGDAPLQTDIWCPPAQFYDPRAMADERGRGRSTWVLVDRPPFSGSVSVTAPPTYTQVLSWQLEKLEAAAGMLGSVNPWPRIDAAPQECISHDANTLIYPGAPFSMLEPIPSLRLKRLRRSMQDAAYLDLLREHRLDHLADTIRDSLVAYVGTDAFRTSFVDGKSIGWPDDPEVFEAARRLMAEELSTSAYGEERGDREEFARSANWRKFLLATRRIETRFEGARIRLQGGASPTSAEVVSNWTIANRTRLPLDANLHLGPLPETWTAPADEANQHALRLESGESKRVSFTEVVPLSAIEAGKTALSLNVGAAPDVRSRARGELSAVIAGPRTGPMKIDGDLSDWPLGMTNVLGNFRLIAGAGSGEIEKSGRDVPQRRTTAFVLHDDEFMYIAVNSELPNGSERPASSHNGVLYEDLVPIGEELVEVLIDPLNSSSRSPGELLHVVVKRSGATLFEKGITTSPPCCTSSPWAAKVEVATRCESDRWTAELRIPLKEIAPSPYAHAIWGLNVTRFDAEDEEFSTWSGAVGNAYDPLSLGNLVIP